MCNSQDLEFRKIYIVEPSHVLGAAKRYSKRISLLTDGGEKSSELKEKIEKALVDFDFSTDCLIPMGKVVSCMITGMVIMDMLPIGQALTIGVYRGDGYAFIEVTR